MKGPAPLARNAAAVVLALAAIAAYSGSFAGPWVFDDLPSIRDNPTIRHLWQIGNILTPPAGTTVGGRPLLNFSLAVNYAISGEKVWSYHALNLAIHILAALTLFGIVRRTLVGQAGLSRRSEAKTDGLAIEPWARQPGHRPGLHYPTLIAFCVALLWTVHPLQTESVAYIVQRAESLMGLFYLLTIYCFIRAVEDEEVGGHLVWFSLSFLACLFGMATKEVMVTAPVIVFLYDRTFVAGTFLDAWRRRWRFYLGLSATWLLLGFLVASTGGNRGGTSGLAAGVSPGAYWLTQFEAICRYLWLSVWPHPLVFDYGALRIGIREAAPFAVPVLALLAATVYGLSGGAPAVGQADGLAPVHRPGLQRRTLGFLGAWFFAILAPTSLVPGALQTIAEHRMYLALAPVLVAGVLGLFALGGRFALAACLGAALGFGGVTARRVESYRTELSLWTDTVARRPGNARARNNLGDALRRGGRLPAAIDQCAEAVRLDPSFPEARFNLGAALLQAGRVPEAAVQLREALRLRPEFAEAHDVAAGILLQQGDAAGALQQYAEALRLAPDSFAARYNYGNALFGLNRPADAAEQYRLALAIQPDSFEAHYNLANALLQLGRVDEAIAQFQGGLRFRPEFADAHFNLAGALERAGLIPEAMREYQEVLRLEPDSADARARLSALSAAK